MHFSKWFLLLVITIQDIYALEIVFSSPPTAAINMPFTWTREPGDGEDVWLRKQKLDDGRPTGFSPPFQVHLGNQSTGNSSIYFNRAGSFVIYFYDRKDQVGQQRAKKATSLTVSINPTSAGAIVSPTSTEPHSPPPSPSSPNGTSPPDRRDSPDIALIIGLILVVTAIIFIIAATLLYMRYRRRRATASFRRNRMINRFDSEDERKSPLEDNTLRLGNTPPAHSEYSNGSFSVTSPIARAMRERERTRNKLLRLSSSTITSGTHSTEYSQSTATFVPSYIPPPPRTRTDRQMLIEEKIQLLQSKIILLQSQHRSSIQSARGTPRIRPLPLPPGSISTPSPPPPSIVPDIETARELERLERTVERLKQIHESVWALMLTDVAPEGLHD